MPQSAPAASTPSASSCGRCVDHPATSWSSAARPSSSGRHRRVGRGRPASGPSPLDPGPDPHRRPVQRRWAVHELGHPPAGPDDDPDPGPGRPSWSPHVPGASGCRCTTPTAGRRSHGVDLPTGPATVWRAAFEAAGFVSATTLTWRACRADRLVPPAAVRRAPWVQALADGTGLPVDVVAVARAGPWAPPTSPGWRPAWRRTRPPPALGPHRPPGRARPRLGRRLRHPLPALPGARRCLTPGTTRSGGQFRRHDHRVDRQKRTIGCSRGGWR